MEEGTLTKALLLIAGTFAGVLGTLATTWGTRHLERKAELRKQERKLRDHYLVPLRMAAQELSNQLRHVMPILQSERDIPDQELKENYHLRYWLRQCKNYIVESNEQWTDEQRRREIAMHSGGVGYDAVATLYTAAHYLCYATLVRLRAIKLELVAFDEKVSKLVDAVRSALAAVEFYPVTQDTAGVSMRERSGRALTYREFCEAVTNDSSRPWFMTLADVFFKLHRQDPDKVQTIIAALDALIKFLDKDQPVFKSGYAEGWI
jgi:hypothetical protein